MEIVYTFHATMRMLERSVSEEDVETVIANPDLVERRDGRILASKRIDSRKIKIIYTIENKLIVVITVC